MPRSPIGIAFPPLNGANDLAVAGSMARTTSP
jgi:hypothetical protein